MPHEMSPGKPTTKRYSEAEKQRAVRAVRQLRKELGTDHGTIKRVAEQLGIGTESLRGWVKQAEIDDGVKPASRRRTRLGSRRSSRRTASSSERTRSCGRRRRISPRRSSTAHRGDRRLRRRAP
jgi:transposase-like protein